MNLGNQILKIRKDNKMSQEQFAEILGVTRQTVSNWENSKNHPDIETLVDISDKFHISLDILLKGDTHMIKKMDKDIKNSKTLKIVTFILVSLLLLIGILFAVNYQMKKMQEKHDNEKYDKIISNINILGFQKDEIGFASIIEDDITYKVYIKKPDALDGQIAATSIQFTDEEAIAATYDGENISVTYLNEDKTTIYCDKDGSLLNDKQNKNNVEIYNSYKDKTIQIVTRMVELFDNIYN